MLSTFFTESGSESGCLVSTYETISLEANLCSFIGIVIEVASGEVAPMYDSTKMLLPPGYGKSLSFLGAGIFRTT